MVAHDAEAEDNPEHRRGYKAKIKSLFLNKDGPGGASGAGSALLVSRICYQSLPPCARVQGGLLAAQHGTSCLLLSAARHCLGAAHTQMAAHTACSAHAAAVLGGPLRSQLQPGLVCCCSSALLPIQRQTGSLQVQRATAQILQTGKHPDAGPAAPAGRLENGALPPGVPLGPAPARGLVREPSSPLPSEPSSPHPGSLSGASQGRQ